MTYKKIRKIFENNEKSKDNTYLVPIISFDAFIRDELMYIKNSDDHSCTVWRAMDGILYDLTPSQIKKFKCVGNCNC